VGLWRKRDDAPTSEDLRFRASETRSVVGWVMGFWLVATLGYLAWLWFEHRLSRDNFNCPVPGQQSMYGAASWQWFPPGKVCSYPGSNVATQYPSDARIVILAFLLALPVVVLPLWVWSEAKLRERLRSAM
jgi:hypothetical protein